MIFKNKTIEFYGTEEHTETMATPKPAINFIPAWYKKTQTYLGEKPWSSFDYNGIITGSSTGTVKKCIPFLDSLTAGYIIPVPFDIHVNVTESADGPNIFISWAYMEYDFLGSHNTLQLGEHPASENLQPGGKIWKINNPWHIKTPPGYSCLFINPMNHQNEYFDFFAGIVDTDTYNDKVNFPFIWKAGPGEFIIKKGTPLIQVIPFKRDTWSSKLSKLNDKTTTHFRIQANKVKSVLVDGYKKFFWQKKKFR